MNQRAFREGRSTDKNLSPVVANNVNLNYIIDQVWPWSTGTGTETGAGQFNFSKYGVRYEFDCVKYGQSTEGKCSQTLVRGRDTEVFQSPGTGR